MPGDRQQHSSFNPSGVQLAQATAKEEVKINFIGHSTYLIESPGGVTIATDYNGVYRPPVTPTVVTMNRAHSTHFTLNPDPAIQYVLHGWSDTPGEKAEHRVLVGDVYIRNVATDIRNRWGDYESFQENGNSIFIFEVAGLCIGHLGHLHHELTDTHYAEIGRLDVLMVPVDGGLTMGADSMSRVVKRLRSALILPAAGAVSDDVRGEFPDCLRHGFGDPGFDEKPSPPAADTGAKRHVAWRRARKAGGAVSQAKVRCWRTPTSGVLSSDILALAISQPNFSVLSVDAQMSASST